MTLKIGWASRDVSAPDHVKMPGQFHMRQSHGVLDSVTVTALAIDGGEDSVIFISMDLVIIRGTLVNRIQEKIREIDPSVPAEKILCNATHTHSAPGHWTGDTWGDPLDLPELKELYPVEKYTEFLVDQTAGAAVEAWTKRQAGGIAWGYGYAIVSHSRRVMYADDTSKRPGRKNNPGFMINGTSLMYGSTNDDAFLGYEAGADHFTDMMYTFDESGNLTGALVNVPCPGQSSENISLQTASFWHETREAIRRNHPGIFILPQCSAAGDLSPRVLHYQKAQERRFKLKYGRERAFAEEFERKDIAERIAEAFDEVLSWAKKDIRCDVKVAHRILPLKLARRLITDEEYEFDKAGLAELEKIPYKTDGTWEERLHTNTSLEARRNRCRSILRRYEEQKTEKGYATEAHVIRIGDIAFASSQFELFMDFGHRIKARSPFEQTFLIQLAGVPSNPGGSYLATAQAAAGQGYSACHYCNTVSPEGGQQLVEATLKTLKELKD